MESNILTRQNIGLNGHDSPASFIRPQWWTRRAGTHRPSMGAACRKSVAVQPAGTQPDPTVSAARDDIIALPAAQFRLTCQQLRSGELKASEASDRLEACALSSPLKTNLNAVPPIPSEEPKLELENPKPERPEAQLLANQILDRIPPRPKGMARPEDVTEAMRARQLVNPEQWTMYFREWMDVVDHSYDQPEYKEAKELNRYGILRLE